MTEVRARSCAIRGLRFERRAFASSVKLNKAQKNDMYVTET